MADDDLVRREDVLKVLKVLESIHAPPHCDPSTSRWSACPSCKLVYDALAPVRSLRELSPQADRLAIDEGDEDRDGRVEGDGVDYDSGHLSTVGGWSAWTVEHPTTGEQYEIIVEDGQELQVLDRLHPESVVSDPRVADPSAIRAIEAWERSQAKDGGA